MFARCREAHQIFDAPRDTIAGSINFLMFIF